MNNVLDILALSVTSLWVAGAVWFFIKGRNQPTLNLRPEAQSPTEKVSIIVPVRNEGHRVLRESITSLLNQNYDDFEVVTVDDRSTDNSRQILREISNKPFGHRMRIVEGLSLPIDWLGKPHALHQGFEVATGTLILTTDADILFHPDALKTAVSHMKRNELDVLSLVPRLRLESFWEKIFMPVFGWFCLLAMPLYKVNDPKRKETIGVGNFFLLSRKALEVVGGFESIKNDVAEDLRLAELVKQKSLRLRVETAPDLISTRMYSGLEEIWEGFSKNLFSALKFSLPKGVAGAASIFVFGCLPLFLSLAMFLLGHPIAGILFGLSYLMQVVIFSMIILNIEQNPVYSVFIPLGFGLYALILMNSVYRIVSGKGVNWKGRSIYEKGGMKPPRNNS